MTEVNVRFNGVVVAANTKKAVISTLAEDRNKKTYQTEHHVKLSKGVKLAEGSCVAITGTLESDGSTNWIEPKTCVLLDEKPEDMNMYAWVEGEAASSFFMPQGLDEFSEKRPFGVASVKVSETRRQRGVVFNSLIATMKKNLKAGAIVRLAGRLQYRKFTTQAGEDREVAEIICNNEYTKVLKLSERANPFAFDGPDESMAGFGKAE